MQAPRSQRYRQAASECIRAAQGYTDSRAADFFYDLARRWTELAHEQETFERNRSMPEAAKQQ